jgi:septum formation protein
MKIVLASASPRRAEILARAGIRFEKHPVDTDETPLAGESAQECVTRLAGEKARRAAREMKCEAAIFVGADTLVVLDDEILGKPTSAEDARRMLKKLSGREHRVMTGIAALRLPDGLFCRDLEITRVRFAPLSEQDIKEYVATGEPMDKAGAYGIQERGGRFAARIEGCYFNVVGLPLARLCAMLRRMDEGGEF